jgi:hypothetical protein
MLVQNAAELLYVAKYFSAYDRISLNILACSNFSVLSTIRFLSPSPSN